MPGPEDRRYDQSTDIRLLDGVAELSRDYDGFVIDLWGVVHDGIAPYPGVVDCLQRLKSADKRTILLSNAPRRATGVIAVMAEMGIPRESYDDVLSSGEVTWQALRHRDDPWFGALGHHCFHLGSPRDEGMRAGLDVTIVDRLEAADFILATGIERDDETVEVYEGMLAAGAARGLPMVCANPDLEVIRGGRRVVCAGALAARYEALGGQVAYRGKPHTPFYQSCLDRLGIADLARIVAIGDSLRTDIAGAQAAGLDAVLVTGGVHADELGIAPGETADLRRLVEICESAGHIPQAAIPAFVW